MIRILVLCAFLASCAHAPDFRKTDADALADSLAGQLASAETALDTARGLVMGACYVANEPAECGPAKEALTNADVAVMRARKAMAEARDVSDKFWFAADKVSEALTAIAAVRDAASALAK